MRIAAMFYVTEITKGVGDHVRVTLNAVTRNVKGSDGYESPNIDWSKFTPSGSITMSVTKGPASAEFERALEEKLDIPLFFEIPELARAE